MCGIVGRWNRKESRLPAGLLSKMTASVRHRGPDDQGMVIFRGENKLGWSSSFYPTIDGGEATSGLGGLGHTRLSVIDLSPMGRQPMCNEDGKIWITYNGEIYDFQSLRKDLVRYGHQFKSRTDTEVILHAYEEWGVSCIKHFNGMFAFALFDGTKGRFFLARDRLGIKPLYYYYGPACFAFASELKALFQCDDIPRILDPCAIKDYFIFGYTPSPRTFFQHIRKLPPGHFLLLDLDPQDWKSTGKPEIESYWDTQFEPTDTPVDEPQCIEELQGLIADSVRMRMVSDVPLGAFLSGGVDSSAVVSLMTQMSPMPIKTFSIGFPEAEYSEVAFAEEVSRHLGTDHEAEVLPHDIHKELSKVLYFYDEPIADTSILPTYKVSSFARKKVTVCLSGDGGDELFGGYYQHGKAASALYAHKVPAPLRLPLAWLRVRGFPWQKSLQKVVSLFLGCTVRECLGIAGGDELSQGLIRPSLARGLQGYSPYLALDRYYLRSPSALPLDRIQYVDLKAYLPEDILTKVDRASMAVALEVRVPYLDYRLVEFAARLPSNLRVRDGTRKYILKRAFADVLPQSVLERTKQGFAVPEVPWLHEEPMVRRLERLTSYDSQIARILIPEKVAAIFKSFREQAPHLGRLIWALIILDEWLGLMERYGGVRIPGEGE